MMVLEPCYRFVSTGRVGERLQNGETNNVFSSRACAPERNEIMMGIDAKANRAARSSFSIKMPMRRQTEQRLSGFADC